MKQPAGEREPNIGPDRIGEVRAGEVRANEVQAREVRVYASYDRPSETRQRRDLFDALIALGAGVGLPAALRRITEVARDVTGARYAVFAATAATRGSVPAVLRAGVGEDPPPPELAEVLRDPGALLGVGSLIRLSDLRDHPRRAELPTGLPASTGLLATPIVAEGELYGGLLLFSRPGVGFTAEHEDALVTVSAATGVVISTAALRADADRRQRWLDASADIVATLLAGDSADNVLELVAGRAREVADADMAAVLAPAAMSGELAVQAAAGADARRVGGVAVAEFAGYIADVMRTGQPRLLAEALADHGGRPPRIGGTAGMARLSGMTPPMAELMPSELASLPARTTVEPAVLDGPAMLVPFAAGHRPLGVLLVGRLAGRPAFGDGDLTMASMFAGHAALAVEFARAQRDREWLAVLEDRDRIARDLHDVVIQRLFVSGLGLQAMARTIDSAPLAGKLEHVVDELDRTVTEIRRSIFSLRSPLVGRDGLRARLLGLCTAAAGMLGAEPHVRLDGPLDTVVPDAIAEHLAAVLREALANITRHAQASQVEVQARTDGAGVLLEVSDNGIGIDPAEQHRGGLAGISRRAQELGGVMRIVPGAAEGTVLIWEVPLATR
jgi:signal transduction histidine kinase